MPALSESCYAPIGFLCAHPVAEKGSRSSKRRKNLSAGNQLGLSLLRNSRLASKDILLDFAGGCFRQLGYEANFLRTLEVRQMITSVIAQLGFRRGDLLNYLRIVSRSGPARIF